MKADQHIGAAFKTARNARSLSQHALGQLLGLRQATVHKIESGERSLKVSELPLVCRVLNLHPAELTAEIDVPDLCPSCYGTPPPGFTCNACGK